MADDAPRRPERRIIRWIDYRLPFMATLRARALRISDPAQSELLVEFRLARRDHAGGDDRHRHLPRDAIYAERAARLRFGRAHHARRQLRLADALRARQRRVDVLSRSSTSTSSAGFITARTRRRANCCGSLA